MINHEAPSTETTIRLAGLDFPIRQVIDLADDTPVPIESKDGCVEVPLSVPLGVTRILSLRP